MGLPTLIFYLVFDITRSPYLFSSLSPRQAIRAIDYVILFPLPIQPSYFNAVITSQREISATPILWRSRLRYLTCQYTFAEERPRAVLATSSNCEIGTASIRPPLSPIVLLARWRQNLFLYDHGDPRRGLERGETRARAAEACCAVALKRRIFP